jgi:predicted nucleic acid-binding protein
MPPPGVVLDTNIVVSVHLKGEGLERFVLDLAMARKLWLFLSAEILEEYRGVLSREKFGIDLRSVEAPLELIADKARRWSAVGIGFAVAPRIVFTLAG